MQSHFVQGIYRAEDLQSTPKTFQTVVKTSVLPAALRTKGFTCFTLNRTLSMGTAIPRGTLGANQVTPVRSMPVLTESVSCAHKAVAPVQEKRKCTELSSIDES